MVTTPVVTVTDKYPSADSSSQHGLWLKIDVNGNIQKSAAMVKRFNVNLLQQQRALLFHIASKIYCHRLRVVSFSQWCCILNVCEVAGYWFWRNGNKYSTNRVRVKSVLVPMEAVYAAAALQCFSWSLLCQQCSTSTPWWWWRREFVEIILECNLLETVCLLKFF